MGAPVALQQSPILPSQTIEGNRLVKKISYHKTLMAAIPYMFMKRQTNINFAPPTPQNRVEWGSYYPG